MENATYFKIGAFIITATVLFVIGLVLLGGGAFLKKKNTIETYIDESVQGLDVGSPVKFRGVPVGEVDQITLTSVEYPTQRRYVLVRAGISPNMFDFPLNDPENARFVAQIQRGLRLRLAPQGLTGTAYLEADYLDPTNNPPLPVDWHPYYPYVPSARSKITQLTDALERILANFEQLDLQRLIGTIQESLSTIDNLVNRSNVDKISSQAVALLSELRDTNRQLREVVGSPDLKKAVTDAAVAAGTAREILEKANKPVTQLVNDLPKTSESLNRLVERLDAVAADLPETSVQARATLQRLNRLISNQQQDIEKTVENLRAVSQSLREIVENSKNYPSQVLFGAPPPPSKVMGR
ncbi:MAG TPA: MlaD family protein [Candidatus Binatia bacterium]|jgi:phospholipid/cholesterol/gamma-HCH transport system substrate-binding protein/paraquat-inducible protein B